MTCSSYLDVSTYGFVLAFPRGQAVAGSFWGTGQQGAPQPQGVIVPWPLANFPWPSEVPPLTHLSKTGNCSHFMTPGIHLASNLFLLPSWLV